MVLLMASSIDELAAQWQPCLHCGTDADIESTWTVSVKAPASDEIEVFCCMEHANAYDAEGREWAGMDDANG
jgi:hypothetical protein